MTKFALQSVGWVERFYETHHLYELQLMGFARAQPILRAAATPHRRQAFVSA